MAKGLRAGLAIDEQERLKALEQENRKLKWVNEILRKASAFFRPGETQLPTGMSRCGNCWDNVVAGSFFSRLKK